MRAIVGRTEPSRCILFLLPLVSRRISRPASERSSMSIAPATERIARIPLWRRRLILDSLLRHRLSAYRSLPFGLDRRRIAGLVAGIRRSRLSSRSRGHGDERHAPCHAVHARGTCCNVLTFKERGQNASAEGVCSSRRGRLLPFTRCRAPCSTSE